MPALGAAAMIVRWQSLVSGGPETQSHGEAHARRAGAGHLLLAPYTSARSASRASPYGLHQQAPLSLLPAVFCQQKAPTRHGTAGGKRGWGFVLQASPIASLGAKTLREPYIVLSTVSAGPAPSFAASELRGDRSPALLAQCCPISSGFPETLPTVMHIPLQVVP